MCNAGILSALVAGIYNAFITIPVLLPHLLYVLISFSMAYISTPLTIRILSCGSFFGSFLAGKIGSHDNDPDICAAYCK